MFNDRDRGDRENLLWFLTDRLTTSQRWWLWEENQTETCRVLTRSFNSQKCLCTYLRIEMPLESGVLRPRSGITIREPYGRKRSVTVEPGSTCRETLRALLDAVGELTRR